MQCGRSNDREIPHLLWLRMVQAAMLSGKKVKFEVGNSGGCIGRNIWSSLVK
jgi:hypothetical protein